MSEVKKEACECSDKDSRKAQIRQAVYGCFFENDQDREYAIDSYNRSTLSLEEISSLLEPLKLKHISDGVSKGRARVLGRNNLAGGSGIY